MGDMQPINISLPEEMVTMIKAKVLSGEYASASEVIQADWIGYRNAMRRLSPGCERTSPKATMLSPPIQHREFP